MLVMIEQVERLGDLNAIVHVRMLGVGLPGAVGRLMVAHEKKGLVLVPPLQIVDRIVGYQVGTISRCASIAFPISMKSGSWYTPCPGRIFQ